MTSSSTAAGASVPLFGSGWDDRELVNAYDAALLEFHIHHPGPGSWLDKATAALAKGQPLPGANAFGTAWYSAAKDKEDDKEAPAAASGSRKRQRTETKSQRKANPYSKPTETAGRAESPTYEPASPGGGGEDEVEQVLAGEEDEYEDGEEEGAEEGEAYEEGLHEPEVYWGPEAPADGSGQVDEGQVFPPPAGSWPGSSTVDHDAALGYALHAQYWAGYWMGVARGAQQAQRAPRSGAVRKQRPQPAANGLRR